MHRAAVEDSTALRNVFTRWVNAVASKIFISSLWVLSVCLSGLCVQLRLLGSLGLLDWGGRLKAWPVAPRMRSSTSVGMNKVVALGANLLFPNAIVVRNCSLPS